MSKYHALMEWLHRLVPLTVAFCIGVIVGALSAFGYRHEADRELLRDYIETQQEPERVMEPVLYQRRPNSKVR